MPCALEDAMIDCVETPEVVTEPVADAVCVCGADMTADAETAAEPVDTLVARAVSDAPAVALNGALSEGVEVAVLPAETVLEPTEVVVAEPLGDGDDDATALVDTTPVAVPAALQEGRALAELDPDAVVAAE